jgi:HD-GYP domain-containing protein (c-di-GMP phosphodiesterase class II)
MLKRIELDELRPGMFIEKLDGSWFKHPFWRTRFVLDDERLAILRSSNLDGVFIDTAKGVDVATAEVAIRPRTLVAIRAAHRVAPAPPPPNAPLSATPPEAPLVRPFRSPDQTAMRAEFGTARHIAGRAEKAVSRIFLESRLGKTINPQSVEPVVEEIFRSLQRNAHAFNGLMRCKQGVPTVYRHSVAVSALMISLAMRMKLTPPEIRTAGIAGLLMDIGLAHLQPGQTDANAPVLVAAIPDRQHTVTAHELLSACDSIPEEVLRVCLYHHERLDGSGYPLGLVGNTIDQFSRMAAICDTFDMLISLDNSGPSLDPAKALQTLADDSARFDPDILNAFIDSVGNYPIGSIVELRSGRLAMVVFADPEGADLPTVHTFYSLCDQRTLRGENIDLRNCCGQDKLIGTHPVQGLDLPDLQSLRETVMTATLKQDW